MDLVYQTDRRAFLGLEWRTDGPLTLDYAATRYEANPAMAAELERGGMTGRDFIVTLFALLNASRDGRADPSQLDALGPARAANARFVQPRAAEIGRIFTVLRTVGREG